MATTRNVEFRLGEDWILEVDCRTSSGAVLADVVDFRFRVASAEPALLLDLHVGDGVTLEDNVATVTITPEMQEGLPPQVGRWEGRAILEDGTVSDQAGGDFKITDSLFSVFP